MVGSPWSHPYCKCGPPADDPSDFSHDLADHACALAGGLEATASKAGHMQENFGKVLIRNDKPVALCRVEPLDRS